MGTHVCCDSQAPLGVFVVFPACDSGRAASLHVLLASAAAAVNPNAFSGCHNAGRETRETIASTTP